jgi:hypothetical protein
MIPIPDRTADRLARIKGVPVFTIDGNSEPMPETVSAYETAKPRADLKPKQLEWLRTNIGIFKTCERMAIQAEEHRRELMVKAGVA